MNIQDESFPSIDDLELSNNSGKNFVFPHNKAHRYGITEETQTNEEKEVFGKKDTSLSLPQQNEDDSTESSNDFCVPSEETSSKTNRTEPKDLQESDNKKSSGFIRHNPNKAVSYQDIHSEYTKRRYKHVESKVGQYIANIKAQDEKRRSSGKFQRHRSMPEALQERETTATILDDSKKHGLLRRSANDLDRLQRDQDSDNYKNLSSTSSLSTRDLDLENGIFLDKQTYEHLLSEKERTDYLQTKLEEKNAAYWRLKQNFDTIRIEYSICKDKLKQQTEAHRLTGSYGINAVSSLGRTSPRSLVHLQRTKDKCTQTSPVPAENKPDNDLFATQFTTDTNNNSFDYTAVALLAAAAHKVLKSVATIQPISLNFNNLVDQDFNSNNINTATMGYLRQRSNSLATLHKSAPLPANISSTASSVPSSSDSAIDIEVTESSNSQHESRREEFIFYEQRSQRFAVVETDNATPNDANTADSNSEYSTIDNRSKCRKPHYLRSRMIRLLGTCVKCKDANN